MTGPRGERRLESGRGERLLAWLIGAYPRSFRQRFAADYLALYRSERRRLQAEKGRLAARWLDVRTIGAALPGVAREWLHEWRRAAGGGVSGGRKLRKRGRGPLRWLDALVTDGRLAVRGLRRSPGFAAAVAVTLGLGVGANAAMFELVDLLFLRPPPYLRDLSATHTLYFDRTRNGVRRPNGSFSYPVYRAVAESSEGFETVAASAFREQVAALGDRPRKLLVMGMSGTMWQLFDLAPAAGRLFGPDEDRLPNGSAVAVLSYAFWRSEYASDPGVLGRGITVGGVRYTIIGVAPPRFRGMGIRSPQLFVPLAAAGSTFIGDDFADRSGTTWLSVVVRPEAGRESAALFSATRAIVAQQREYLGEERAAEMEIEAEFQPLLFDRGPYARPISRFTLWLLAMSGIVFLVACANVATLMTGRALRRRKDTAVRAALGIRGRRVVLLPLLESVGLALAAGLVAVPAGSLVVATISRSLLPDAAEALGGLAPRSAVFAAVILCLGGLLAGLYPAFQARRVDLGAALRTAGPGGRPRSRLQALLPVGQAALSALLLVGAGLFVRSVQKATHLDLGYDADRVLMVETEGSGAFDVFVPAESLGFSMTALVERAATVPGVEGVALATGIPFNSNNIISVYRSDGTAAPGVESGAGCAGDCSSEAAEFAMTDVTPDYFDVMGTRILEGRGFDASDAAGAAPVIVVSESLARLLWPADDARGFDALGKCARVAADAPCLEVVGVAEDIRRGDIQNPRQFLVYRAWDQADRPFRGTIVVRAARTAADLAEPLRRELQALVPGTVYVRTQPLKSLVDEQLRSWTVGARVFGAFGVLALVMAAVGLFSVVAFEVAQRTREFGVRMTLGARAADLVRLVVRKGVRVTAAGVGLGLAAAFLLAGRLEGLLFDVGARDPLTFILVAAVLLAAAATASLLPAVRASRVDPQVILRSE